MVSWSFREARLQEVGLAQHLEDHDFSSSSSSKTDFMTCCKAYSRIAQTLLSNSLKLIDFEINYNRQNLPLFSRQRNMQWSRNMVHSHFTLCLRARDYIKQLSQHPWSGLWRRVKGLTIIRSRLLAHVWSGPHYAKREEVVSMLVQRGPKS
jgi:hypothetical protein